MMYLLTSPEFSLRNEVLFHKLRPFFDTDPALSGLTVLLWESDGALKNLMDIQKKLESMKETRLTIDDVKKIINFKWELIK